MIQLVNATANRIPFPDKYFHCVVTSPPYWGLRDYGLPPRVYGGSVGCEHVWGNLLPEHHPGQVPDSKWQSNPDLAKGQTAGAGQFCQLCGAWRGCLGLEPTPEMYVEHMVEVFQEVRRVLRPDGSVWLNLGDSYAGTPRVGSTADKQKVRWQHGADWKDRPQQKHIGPGLKPKDLVGIPWRVAFALQADGWWLRSDIIWAKTNPMPESVTDRPTKAHEYVFLLTKNARYFYDADAVKEPLADSTLADGRNATGRHTQGKNFSKYFDEDSPDQAQPGKPSWYRAKTFVNPEKGRNRRTVWTISTKPYKGAHFATYPPALVEPCIKAGTSERGVCPECGAGWERVVESEIIKGSGGKPLKQYDVKSMLGSMNNNPNFIPGTKKVTTLGWRPTCSHYPETDLWQEYPRQEKDESDEDYAQRMEPIRLERQRLLALWKPVKAIPATVLDPFVGSGTTLLVARQLGRNGIGLDLSYDYLSQQARKRLGLDKLAGWGEPNIVPDDCLPLFQAMM